VFKSSGAWVSHAKPAAVDRWIIQETTMKTTLCTLVVLGLALALTTSATAQRPGRGEIKKKAIERFDKNKDGELDAEERAAAKEEMKKRRAERGREDGPRGRRRRPDGPRPEGRRGERPRQERLERLHDGRFEGGRTELRRRLAHRAMLRRHVLGHRAAQRHAFEHRRAGDERSDVGRGAGRRERVREHLRRHATGERREAAPRAE
jgi:hypothetical protein